MKTGTIFSNNLIFRASSGCSTPVGTTFLAIQYSMTAMSYDLDRVTARCTTASESSAVIGTICGERSRPEAEGLHAEPW
jgi:hypothetical protein